MNTGAIEPRLDFNDQSKNDDSIKQEHVTINASSGAVINSNSGNGRSSLSRMSAMVITIFISILCDIGLGCFLVTGQKESERRFEQYMKQSDVKHEEIMKSSKAGTIWILRDDLIKTMDFHEATKTITTKQYRRLFEEYKYYLSIGGNYDVEEKFETFKAKIYGTGEIQMTK